MVKYMCDRCGVELEPGLMFISTAFRPNYLEIKIKDGYNHDKTIDLCQNCKEQFYKWLSDKNNPISTKE